MNWTKIVTTICCAGWGVVIGWFIYTFVTAIPLKDLIILAWGAFVTILAFVTYILILSEARYE